MRILNATEITATAGGIGLPTLVAGLATDDFVVYSLLSFAIPAYLIGYVASSRYPNNPRVKQITAQEAISGAACHIALGLVCGALVDGAWYLSKSMQ